MLTAKEQLIATIKDCIEDLNVYNVPPKYILNRFMKAVLRYFESGE